MPGAMTSETIPGPPWIPLLGWRGQWMLLAHEPLAFLLARYHRYGCISALVRGDPAIIFALGPAANRQIISHDEVWNSRVGGLAAPHTLMETGRGLILGAVVGREEEYRRHVAAHREMTVTLTQQMLDRWGLGCLLDVTHVMYELSLQIATATLFGGDVGEAAQHIARIVRRWRQYLTAPLPGLRGCRSLGTDRHARHLAAAFAMIVAALEVHGHDDATVRYAAPFLMMVPAYSAAAITWTLFLLSQHPRILAELRMELSRVLGGAAPTLDQLADLPLLDRIVKESLRLFPPVSIDCCTSSAPFDLGPHRVPEGTTVVYSPYITHHLPELYLNPQHFRPERWLFIEPEPHEYLPFGAFTGKGDEVAIAITQIKLILAMIVQRYALGLTPGARLDPSAGVPLVPRGGLAMIIAPPDRPVTRRMPQGMINEMVMLP